MGESDWGHGAECGGLCTGAKGGRPRAGRRLGRAVGAVGRAVWAWDVTLADKSRKAGCRG